MADSKKPSDFDDDRTVVDIRRAPSPADDSDKTVVGPISRPARPAAADEDEGRTVVVSRRPPAPGAADDSDKTMIGPRGGGVDPGDRTVIRPSGAPAPGPASGASFEIVGLSGEARGRRFPVSGPEILVGSSANCQVVLPGAEGVHAKLVRTAEGYELQNLGTAGSIVLSGGRKVARTKLESGALIKLGSVVARYVQSGELFSSEYSDADFAGGGIAAMLRDRPLYLVIAAAVVVLAVVALWPSKSTPKRVVAKSDTAKAEKQRKEEIDGLLTSGEVLFNAGKLLAPADQPDADNAFSKFNEVLALDPGNAVASQWLKRIDEERDRMRRARDEEEQRRIAAERERRERQKRELTARVNAILEQGDAFFAKGQVTEPVGQNALAKYREALQVDPESQTAQQRMQRAVDYYVERGDQFRERNDLWTAIENYRRASRATGGKDDEIERRIREIEATLRSGFAGTGTHLIMYRDDRGQLFVYDEAEKVPARFKDRAIEVNPQPAAGKAGRAR